MVELTAMDATLKRVHELFELDAEHGQLRWKVTLSNAAAAGSLAGCANDPKGYRRVRFDGQRHMLHRIVFAMANGRWPTEQVDHINLDKTDNRPGNLREASREQNCQNIGIPAHNTSGTKGAYFVARRNKWAAQINVAGKRKFLGHYGTQDEAAMAYKQAALKLYGEFARPE